MTQRVTSAIVITVVAVIAIGLFGAEPAPPIFTSVVQRGDTIVAVIARGRWNAHGDSVPRIVEAGDSITLRDGASFTLAEHHTSYDVHCHISSAPVGLQITEIVDARSFGGAQQKKVYFITAK